MFIRFLPNLVLRFALLHPLSVPNCSLIRARIRVLWQILQSVRKEVEEEEKKNKEKTLNLAARISEMAGEIFFKFGM